MFALIENFIFLVKKPYEFDSRVCALKEHDVVEGMTLGLGWRTNYFYDGSKVVLQHRSYVWRIFDWNIPIPLEIIIGKSNAVEEVIDDNTYRISMIMTHPLFGFMYSYSGDFKFTRMPT